MKKNAIYLILEGTDALYEDITQQMNLHMVATSISQVTTFLKAHTGSLVNWKIYQVDSTLLGKNLNFKNDKSGNTKITTAREFLKNSPAI